jgi:hypothetical protein
MKAGRLRALLWGIGLVAVLALGAEPASGSCQWEYGGKCAWPVWSTGTVEQDCDCDEYGCGDMQGPPQYWCVRLNCSGSSASQWFCIQSGNKHVTCREGSDLEISCPCSGWECWFEE